MYVSRARYSQEAFKGTVAKPAYREAAGRAMFEAAGVKLHDMWYSGNGDVICVVQADAVSASMVGMVVMASGGFTSVESIELITMGQMMDAMKGAGAVAARFRPPGK